MRFLFRCLILAILISLFCQPLFSQEKSKTNIAVIDLGSRGGLSQSEIGTLTDRLRSLLVRTNAFNVVDRGRMEEILAEQGFQMTGCTSAECAVEAGQILGVEEMITGSIGKIGQLYTIDIILIDVGTSQIIKSITRDYRGEVEGLVGLMRSISDELGGITRATPISTPQTGGISIKSQTNGAEIFIDNRRAGKSPLKLEELSLGEHQIKLQANGYAPYEDKFQIEKGKTKSYSAKLKKIFRIKIGSTPADALVYVNNKNIGKTPFNSTGVEGTKLTIQLKKDNYKIWSKNVELTKNIDLNARLEMTKQYKDALAARVKQQEQRQEKPQVKKDGGSKVWWWVGGGAVLAGTAAYLLLSGDEKTESKDFPAPPGRPE